MAAVSDNPGIELCAENFNIVCEDPSTVVRNYFGVEEYCCDTSFFGGNNPLEPWVGYVIILGFGLVFGLFTVGLVYIDWKLLRTKATSEWFNTAGRTIRTGLTASVIVSQWTWAATLLQSSNVAFRFGISGPFWYAAGATIQVILFSILAVQVKRRAPTCHTFLEIIRARWGTIAHIVFMVFGFITNIIVTSMLILGGSAVVNALTGIDTDVASILIPLGVIVYTLAGGLKATFVASYFNTAVILISLCIFAFLTYATFPELGSAAAVYDRLQYVVTIEPVEDNRDGSYLTMYSLRGFMFGLTNIVGNFGTVFVDQAYWQSAIAATPTASWKGYILGGLCWFSIPFTLATSLGLAANALSLPVTFAEAGAGLVPPATATHMMGTGGSLLILIMLFMAVTSTGAAEQIAVSSLISYDIFRTYAKPEANGKQIIRISRICIAAYGIFSGCLGIALNHIGISLGWLYLFMGVLIGSAVVPVALCICWKRANGTGAIIGAIAGMLCALAVWLGFGSSFEGGITIDNLGRDEVMLAGNLVAICLSGIIVVAYSFWRPEDCDWEATTKQIPLIEEDPNAHLTQATEEEMTSALKWIMIWGIGLSLVLVVVWPLLTLPLPVFTLGYWTFWVVLSILWGLLATIAMVILPVYESRSAVLGVLSCGKIVTAERKAYLDSLAEQEKLEDAVNSFDEVEGQKADVVDDVSYES
uniref:Urea transporter n=1 Tax=Rhodosorus marinus TaxID=101924 RepID=A0A7S2ZAV8_9RHOD|mmetsp:Transcript_12795/g.51340  ORF Transcript_12795/g.51340 Transcript_12795/m.51340 type:complete len:702 (+) Transcript_12795:214-2319(+)|eukprot:CAMPEP_0113956896 /NCGR_PEP_ID=MMETSP0011_2-20120614/2363_1 /TAXON_ID=101924 /ORGANISM="Rhodosorus marinus" /LENGTH=701 /DNA_ID=CAMNT_0000967187 /DNA_START=34 /DNA_END=2139 /DNA_ORIENTATION=+ /assembly_acc=CAM_ASM_000156